MVRRGGSLESLFPVGVESIEDLPHEFVQVVDHAMRVLHWQENLTHDEVPPSWMWPLEWELESWFEEVDRKRKEKYGDAADDREEVPMMKNDDPEVAERFGRR